MSEAIFIERVDKKRLAVLVKPLIGMPVSSIWKGNGTAIFFEIGNLKKADKLGEAYFQGEATLMIEWDWRIEKTNSIFFGSFTTDKKIDNRLNALLEKSIQKIQIEGRLPEIVIELSQNLWVHSFSTTEGQPQWTLFLPDKSWLCVARGSIIREKRK